MKYLFEEHHQMLKKNIDKSPSTCKDLQGGHPANRNLNDTLKCTGKYTNTLKLCGLEHHLSLC